MNDEQVHWQGVGRWLSFLIAAVLVIASIPNFSSYDLAIAVGVNVFLGLLLFASVAAGSRRAPMVLLVLMALTALHAVSALLLRRSILGAAIEGGLLIVIVFAWVNLRRQAAAMNGRGSQQAD